jgi:hypothetical protein
LAKRSHCPKQRISVEVCEIYASEHFPIGLSFVFLALSKKRLASVREPQEHRGKSELSQGFSRQSGGAKMLKPRSSDCAGRLTVVLREDKELAQSMGRVARFIAKNVPEKAYS